MALPLPLLAQLFSRLVNKTSWEYLQVSGFEFNLAGKQNVRGQRRRQSERPRDLRIDRVCPLKLFSFSFLPFFCCPGERDEIINKGHDKFFRRRRGKIKENHERSSCGVLKNRLRDWINLLIISASTRGWKEKAFFEIELKGRSEAQVFKFFSLYFWWNSPSVRWEIETEKSICQQPQPEVLPRRAKAEILALLWLHSQTKSFSLRFFDYVRANFAEWIIDWRTPDAIFIWISEFMSGKSKFISRKLKKKWNLSNSITHEKKAVKNLSFVSCVTLSPPSSRYNCQLGLFLPGDSNSHWFDEAKLFWQFPELETEFGMEAVSVFFNIFPVVSSSVK